MLKLSAALGQNLEENKSSQQKAFLLLCLERGVGDLNKVAEKWWDGVERRI